MSEQIATFVRSAVIAPNRQGEIGFVASGDHQTYSVLADRLSQLETKVRQFTASDIQDRAEGREFRDKQFRSARSSNWTTAVAANLFLTRLGVDAANIQAKAAVDSYIAGQRTWIETSI